MKLLILFHKTKNKKKRKETEVLKGRKTLQGRDIELQLWHNCLCVYGCVHVWVQDHTNMQVCISLVYVHVCDSVMVPSD